MTLIESGASVCIVCLPEEMWLGRRNPRLDYPATEIAGHRVHLACADRLTFALEYLANGDLVDRTADVLRWASNNQCPFADLTALWVRLGEITPAQAAATEVAREHDTAEFLADYREAQANVQPSAEDLFEMRAAFGEGAKVVNVITRRTTVL